MRKYQILYLTKLIEYMRKEYSFEVQDNSLSFYGTCAKCKDKGEN